MLIASVKCEHTVNSLLPKLCFDPFVIRGMSQSPTVRKERG